MQENEKLPFIDLDALVKPVARIKLFGKMRSVMPVTGRIFELAERVKETRDAKKGDTSAAAIALFTEMRAAAAESVVDPSLTEQEVSRLSVEMVGQIALLSRGAVDQVRGMIAKNGKSSARRAQGRASR